MPLVSRRARHVSIQSARPHCPSVISCDRTRISSPGQRSPLMARERVDVSIPHSFATLEIERPVARRWSISCAITSSRCPVGNGSASRHRAFRFRFPAPDYARPACSRPGPRARARTLLPLSIPPHPRPLSLSLEPGFRWLGGRVRSQRAPRPPRHRPWEPGVSGSVSSAGPGWDRMPRRPLGSPVLSCPSRTVGLSSPARAAPDSVSPDAERHGQVVRPTGD